MIMIFFLHFFSDSENDNDTDNDNDHNNYIYAGSPLALAVFSGALQIIIIN